MNLQEVPLMKPRREIPRSWDASLPVSLEETRQMASALQFLHPVFEEMTSPGLKAALAQVANSGTDERGAIFTKREVVEFILDLAGYTPTKALHKMRLLEPSVGVGDFLLPAISRLLKAYDNAGAKRGADYEALKLSVRAVEIHRESLAAMRADLTPILQSAGFSSAERRELLDAWLVEGDFLLSPLPGAFDFVVGNPPYVRQELIPEALLMEYRRRFATLYDRADIYIPFIERSLSLLSSDGVVAFICADRWMKNRYGGPLRNMIAQSYRLKFFVDMVDTPAFHTDVIAYPAITVISKEKSGSTRIAYRPEISSTALTALAKDLQKSRGPLPSHVQEIENVASGDKPWVLSSADNLSLLRRLEEQFPALEETGCKVGIGVATGADQVFIAPFDTLDVEADRKVPLAMTRDILDGSVKWRGYGVINPFADEGGLVRLEDYPRLAAYFERHGAAIKDRHVSRKNPNGWYRTIDRITPSLALRPKLLIPDIKGQANVVYEDGKLYPHHNLYFVVAEEWNLHALRAVLLSDVTRLFISTYSTKMRGGYFRFQAQYLRRIRLPQWKDLSPAIQTSLKVAGKSGDVVACNDATALAYGLTAAERLILSNQGSSQHGS